jgi:DNA-directed RNA polymerase specialized sigma24 family protein
MVDGFARYVEQRHERLCRAAFLLTRDWAAAEDLLQTSLIKASCTTSLICRMSRSAKSSDARSGR